MHYIEINKNRKRMFQHSAHFSASSHEHDFHEAIVNWKLNYPLSEKNVFRIIVNGNISLYQRSSLHKTLYSYVYFSEYYGNWLLIGMLPHNHIALARTTVI